MKLNRLNLIFFLLASGPGVNLFSQDLKRSEDLLTISDGVAKVGIDREKGATITWLSWAEYPNNVVNSADPGRLIQQSYYAGKALDRRDEGQHKAWSPWTWNPIQGGGVGSWARVTEFERNIQDQVLFGETIPKLWDMPDEEAAAVMRQWTGFEDGMPGVMVVRCEFVSMRDENDRWGPAVARHQELPAFYFTRNFGDVKSYLGDGQWRDESQAPGPPWGRAKPPLNVMACFNPAGQGIAVFSPSATEHWNFGPHGKSGTKDPAGGPCMHIAPLATIKLGRGSTLRYRYWMVVGSKKEIGEKIDHLIGKYQDEKFELTNLRD